MSPATGLHDDDARRQSRHELVKLQAREFLAERDRSIGARAMNLENVLCQIDADDCNLLHGCPPFSFVAVDNHDVGTQRCRRGRAASTPSEIDEMLARLQALSDEHFNCAPDEAGWAMVGTLEHYASLLKRITDSAFGEGEHAR